MLILRFLPKKHVNEEYLLILSLYQETREIAIGAMEMRRCTEGGFFIDNLLVPIHFIIEMIWWTGLAPWEFEFPFSGILISTFLVDARKLILQVAGFKYLCLP